MGWTAGVHSGTDYKRFVLLEYLFLLSFHFTDIQMKLVSGTILKFVYFCYCLFGLFTGSTDVSESADNQLLMRFPSQHLWDSSRVVLSQTADLSSPHFINASHVSLPQVS